MKKELEDRVEAIPLYQETDTEPVWDILQGSKDDVFIYDRCGRLTYFVPLPLSLLNKPFVGIALYKTYFGEPCGSCDNSTINYSEFSLSEDKSNVTKSSSNVSTGRAANESQSPHQENIHQGHVSKHHFHHKKHIHSHDAGNNFTRRNSSREVYFRDNHQENSQNTEIHTSSNNTNKRHQHHLHHNNHHHHHHHNHHYYHRFQNRTRHSEKTGLHGNSTKHHRIFSHINKTGESKTRAYDSALQENIQSEQWNHNQSAINTLNFTDKVDSSIENMSTNMRITSRHPNHIGRGKRMRLRKANVTESRSRRHFYRDSCSSIEDETCTQERRKFHLILECCHMLPGNRIASTAAINCALHSMNDVECSKLYHLRECCRRKHEKIVKHLPLIIPVPLMCEGFSPSMCEMTRRLGFVRNDCCPTYTHAANESVIQEATMCKHLDTQFCIRLNSHGLVHKCCSNLQNATARAKAERRI